MNYLQNIATQTHMKTTENMNQHYVVGGIPIISNSHGPVSGGLNHKNQAESSLMNIDAPLLQKFYVPLGLARRSPHQSQPPIFYNIKPAGEDNGVSEIDGKLFDKLYGFTAYQSREP